MVRRPRLDRELERYLVAGETVIVAVRRHWFHLFREIALALGATVLAFWVDVNVPLTSGGQLVHNVSWILWWASIAWLAWVVANWRRDWFVATDKRFLLFFGFIRRKVAMMPLLKVTDMTYDRSLLGRIIGYGTFRMESAGQAQAMSVIDHVPDADAHYRAICSQLFGPGSVLRLNTGYPQPPPPAAGGDGDGDGGSGPAGPDAGAPPSPPAGGAPVERDPDLLDLAEPLEPAIRSPISRPESWYRSSNRGGPSRLGDTGEIPVVRVPAEDGEVPLYPPPHWSDRG